MAASINHQAGDDTAPEITKSAAPPEKEDFSVNIIVPSPTPGNEPNNPVSVPAPIPQPSSKNLRGRWNKPYWKPSWGYDLGAWKQPSWGKPSWNKYEKPYWGKPYWKDDWKKPSWNKWNDKHWGWKKPSWGKPKWKPSKWGWKNSRGVNRGNEYDRWGSSNQGWGTSTSSDQVWGSSTSSNQEIPDNYGVEELVEELVEEEEVGISNGPKEDEFDFEPSFIEDGPEDDKEEVEEFGFENRPEEAGFDFVEPEEGDEYFEDEEEYDEDGEYDTPPIPKNSPTACNPVTQRDEDCTNTHCCEYGYQCLPSHIDGSDRWICYGPFVEFDDEPEEEERVSLRGGKRL